MSQNQQGPNCPTSNINCHQSRSNLPASSMSQNHTMLNSSCRNVSSKCLGCSCNYSCKPRDSLVTNSFYGILVRDQLASHLVNKEMKHTSATSNAPCRSSSTSRSLQRCSCQTCDSNREERCQKSAAICDANRSKKEEYTRTNSLNDIPSKHETLTQCWADAGLTSATLGQHQSGIGSGCWAAIPPGGAKISQCATCRTSQCALDQQYYDVNATMCDKVTDHCVLLQGESVRSVCRTSESVSDSGCETLKYNHHNVSDACDLSLSLCNTSNHAYQQLPDPAYVTSCVSHHKYKPSNCDWHSESTQSNDCSTEVICQMPKLRKKKTIVTLLILLFFITLITMTVFTSISGTKSLSQRVGRIARRANPLSGQSETSPGLSLYQIAVEEKEDRNQKDKKNKKKRHKSGRKQVKYFFVKY